MSVYKNIGVATGVIVLATLGSSAHAGAQSANTTNSTAVQPSAQMVTDAQGNANSVDTKKVTTNSQNEALQLAEREAQASKNATTSPSDLNGWVKSGSYWYYYKNRVAQKGWLQWGGKWYYLWEFDGRMLTDTDIVTNSGRYFFGSSGAMATGWHRFGSEWYYADPTTGAARKGWSKIGGKWYYFENTMGSMHTGWLSSGGKRYYLGSDGAMRTGWLKLGTAWFYLRPSDGAMLTGPQYIDGRWHAFHPILGVWLGYAE